MRTSVGPTKNLLSKRQRDAQQDTETLWSLAGLFRFESKKQFLKLGRFTDVFAEITDENELECRSPLATEPESTDNLSPCREKVKPETGNLSTFFYFFRAGTRATVRRRTLKRCESGKILPPLSMPTLVTDMGFNPRSETCVDYIIQNKE